MSRSLLLGLLAGAAAVPQQPHGHSTLSQHDDS
jgi:hypothetical protein